MRDQPNRPGPTFRAHLTDDLRIVKSLIESRIVVESGFAHSTGGKRPVLLRLNDKDLYAIGVSLHIARYVVVVCGPDGAEVARTEIRVGAIYQRFGQLVREDVPEVVALFEAVADRLAAVVLDLVNSLDLDVVSLAGPGFAHLGDDFQ